MSDYAFEVELNRSQERAELDIWAIQQLLPSCESIKTGDLLEDIAGIDYLAKLRGGREVPIDAKYRKRGSSKYWKRGEPELALERWSVCPEPPMPGKVGWTLDTAKETEYVLFSFNPEDSTESFLMPFQTLRSAFLQNGKHWLKEYGKDGDWFYESSNGGEWRSAAIFVPVSEVRRAIGREMGTGGVVIPCAGCGGEARTERDGRWWCADCG